MIDLFKIEKYRENNRIEAKKSLGGFPHSVWETYSAFANTLGGVILLGVEERNDKSLHPVDLPKPEWLVAEFWTGVNDKTKVSANILQKTHIQTVEMAGKTIVAITVPRAPRAKRPVYIGGNPFTGSYKRSGEGDYKCTKEEVERMLMQAAQAEERTAASLLIEQKRKIIEYVTDRVTASAGELSDKLQIPLKEMRVILSDLEKAEILINVKGKYRLKS